MVAVTMAGSDLGHFDDEESPEAMLVLSVEVPEVVPIKVEVIGIFTELEVLLWLEPIVPAVVPPIVPAVVPPVVRGHEDYLLNDE